MTSLVGSETLMERCCAVSVKSLMVSLQLL